MPRLRLIPSGRVAVEYTGGSVDHMAGETHSAAEESRRPAPRQSVRTFSQRAWARVAEVAARRMAPLAASPVPEPEPVAAPPPEEVLDLDRPSPPDDAHRLHRLRSAWSWDRKSSDP